MSSFSWLSFHAFIIFHIYWLRAQRLSVKQPAGNSLCLAKHYLGLNRSAKYASASRTSHYRSQTHVGRRFLRKLCFGNYVSETMFRKLCFGNYVSETMFRKLCFGNHVSETMFRKPRFLRKLKRILRKLKTILRKLEKFLWKLHVKLGIQPIDGRVFFT